MRRFVFLLALAFALPIFAESYSCNDLISSRLFDHFTTAYQPQLSADRSKSARLHVKGGQTLSGEVTVDPAKNAYLPILAATLLNKHPVRLIDLPNLRDMETFLEIFKTLGVKVEHHGNDVVIDASDIKTNIATCDLVKTMRASVLMLGPMLGRFQGGQVGLPGGCPIGSRPIDIHLTNLKKMGALIEEADTYVRGATWSTLKGTHLKLSFPSVGATQNLIMAAVLAEGVTTIENAAREPEGEDLIRFLNAMGAKITIRDDGIIEIIGVKELKPGVEYRAIGDRIEAATYIIAALMAKSKLMVKGFDPTHIQAVLDTLEQMGARLEIGGDYVKVYPTAKLKAVDVTTAPHPGFPTDVQAQLMALMTQAEGVSSIKETIFENRFAHAHELNLMGADIEIRGDTAFINGPTPLHGAGVRSTDLRAGIALVMSALIAKGDSVISDIYYVERGYNRFIEKFREMGAGQMIKADKDKPQYPLHLAR